MYASIPSNVTAAGCYTSPINVESLLRNKVDLYSTLNNETGLFNKAMPTSFLNNTFAPSTLANSIVNPIANQLNTVSPVECGVQTGYVYGQECGAKIGQIIAARLNTFLGQEQAVLMGARWCSEVCAKLGQELAVRLLNGWSVEECARWCYTFGAQQGAELGAVIAQRLGAIYTAEFGARVGSEIFSEVCAKLCYVVAARVNESRVFGRYNAFSNNFGSFERFGGQFPQTWTGLNNLSGVYGYPTTFGPNTWTNTWGRPELFNTNAWSNAPVQHEKLCNISFRPSSEIALYTLTNPIRIVDAEGNRQLFLAFELKSYKPEEICVTLNKAERSINIEAAHDVKEGKEHQISRKYSRKFVLPESLSKVDLTKVELKSFVNAEGYLIVEACLPKMTTEEIAKCPTMSQLYNKMPFFGAHNTFNTFGGINSITSHVNNVKPVTVKTA